MTAQWTLLQMTLWYCVIAWSTWFGGTLYQMLVVVPMWSENPPHSVHDFFGRTRYARTVRRFFGPRFMAARAVPIAIALGLAWDLPEHQFPLALALGCVVGAIVHTKFWVYPINAQLIDRAGGGLSAAEVRALARSWVAHDRVRFAVGCVALAALLWAFRLPFPADTDPAGTVVAAPGGHGLAHPGPMRQCLDSTDAFLFLGGNDLARLRAEGLICSP